MHSLPLVGNFHDDGRVDFVLEHGFVVVNKFSESRLRQHVHIFPEFQRLRHEQLDPLRRVDFIRAILLDGEFDKAVAELEYFHQLDILDVAEVQRRDVLGLEGVVQDVRQQLDDPELPDFRLPLLGGLSLDRQWVLALLAVLDQEKYQLRDHLPQLIQILRSQKLGDVVLLALLEDFGALEKKLNAGPDEKRLPRLLLTHFLDPEGILLQRILGELYRKPLHILLLIRHSLVEARYRLALFLCELALRLDALAEKSLRESDIVAAA